MKLNLLVNKKCLILLSVLLIGCQPNSLLRLEPSKTQQEIKISPTFKQSFKLHQKDNNLLFTVTLKNNTQQPITLSKRIHPFGLIHENRQLHLRSPIFLVGYDESVWFETLEPNESYDYVYYLNKRYSLEAGINDYYLAFHKPFYDIEENDRTSDDLEKIHFKWYKDEHSDQGYLISYEGLPNN